METEAKATRRPRVVLSRSVDTFLLLVDIILVDTILLFVDIILVDKILVDVILVNMILDMVPVDI